MLQTLATTQSALIKKRASGNSLFVVEHDLEVIRKADWIVDVGPLAGEQGGHILNSGEPEGLKAVKESLTRRYLFMERVKRLVRVDQKPIGRTPRSNLATYTGLFDSVRKLFAATKAARAHHYDAGRFSFNVAKGRCETCEGEGSVMVELLFLASVYAPCPACHGARYNEETL